MSEHHSFVMFVEQPSWWRECFAVDAGPDAGFHALWVCVACFACERVADVAEERIEFVHCDVIRTIDLHGYEFETVERFAGLESVRIPIPRFLNKISILENRLGESA